ncbi:MAG TPA: hypothetical protein DEF85_08025 [Clostridiaceae bacterium]|jgi:hypothetical protein|nr:hypothetical protein [Clostridiaceae bacterium]HBF77370.1 hypothetical protein [Clostridiaceae bacterium]HBN28088.1 hypothetical protein [Clostridiaceae bacterium]HBX48821.1 hypothetical protein [Clostridiaceae bacterium]HCL51038.1 hypothetical protein [Clostridiaceae bacterium]
MEATSLVLMKKENGILATELGSYKVEEGLNYVFKAYVEDNKVKIYLTTDRDVSDEEYTKIYDLYNYSIFEKEKFIIKDVDDEYNPVWLVEFEFSQDDEINEENINSVIKIHSKEMKRIAEIF